MNNTNKILILLVIVLVAIVSIASGYFLRGNTSNNSNNATTINQTNTTVTNNSNQSTQTEKPHNDVPYRITSNTPDCPNCGSNNIAQLADSRYDNDTDTWFVLSQCRYCGYQWTHQSPNMH
ncbi:MAG TPA: hypothetical protein PLC38_02175 [Methanobacterium sp.]|nr:MAG: hypothetical protein FGO69_05635 [Methanobacterium sp.]HOI71073.1 hypothetical protein [Methanobacterium sp.]